LDFVGLGLFIVLEGVLDLAGALAIFVVFAGTGLSVALEGLAPALGLTTFAESAPFFRFFAFVVVFLFFGASHFVGFLALVVVALLPETIDFLICR
jgi:hypothetical protein